MSFISAMASADVNIDVIFKELASQPIYGEIKNEAEWITRDTELLGIDILTAISKAAQRTPSTKFQEFLQGVVPPPPPEVSSSRTSCRRPSSSRRRTSWR